MATSWSRRSAASSKRSSVASAFIRARRFSVSSSVLPERNRLTSSTERRYCSTGTSSTHGAGQRLIWYCRQGRRRLEKTLSWQVRSWKWRFTTRRVSRMEDALEYGPK